MLLDSHTALLNLVNLQVNTGERSVLKGIDLIIQPGTVHVIMGPNGSGKSTLAKVLAGHPDHTVVSGEVIYQGQNLLALKPEERARAGVFLAFQNPVEIPGVSNVQFLKTALNQIRRYRGESELDAMDFLAIVKKKLQQLKMDPDLLYRSVDEGFSGGEKKRNSILQMLLLEPNLVILDEPDSGLDIDALQVIAEGVNTLRAPERSFLIITHYQRLLNYIKPDAIHVLAGGKIVRSGGPELATELERTGYGELISAE